MPESRLGIGVVGLGRVAMAHIRGFVDGTTRSDVVAVCDTDARRANDWAVKTGASAHTDVASLLRDDSVGAVSILLPHPLHYAVAKQALEAGKHVSIEKPLAVSIDECLDLMRIAGENDQLLYVAENTRYVRAYQATAALLEAGELGAIRHLRTMVHGSAIEEYLDPASQWKARAKGVGALIDAAPHTFYLLKWLFGEVESVQTVAHYWLKEHVVANAEVEDSAVVCGRLCNGATFTSEYCLTVEVPWSERLEVYGDHGSLIVDQLREPVAVHYRGAKDFTGEPLAVVFDPSGWKDTSIASSARDFVDAVLDGRRPLVETIDAAYSVLVIEKAYESLAQGGINVRLDGANLKLTERST